MERPIFVPATSLLVGRSPLRGCSLLAPRGRPKSLAAPSAAIFEMTPGIVISGLTGFISGLLLSIPVGPVNLTITNEGARRGFRYAALIGLGATTMEVIYCSIAFTGFATFFSTGYVKTGMEVITFAVMIFLGIKMLRAKTVRTTSKMGAKVEEKFHPHSAFMTGFARTMGNLGVLAWWIVLSIYFIAHKWVDPSLGGKGACVAGVALGTSVWFSGLGYAVSLGHGKFSDGTLLRIERGSGIILLLLGLADGIKILLEMRAK